MGAAQIFDLTGEKQGIDESALRACWVDGTERVLIKTGSSRPLKKGQFNEEFSFLKPDAAEFLIRSGVQLVGIDSISVDGFAAVDLPVFSTAFRSGYYNR